MTSFRITSIVRVSGPLASVPAPGFSVAALSAVLSVFSPAQASSSAVGLLVGAGAWLALAVASTAGAGASGATAAGGGLPPHAAAHSTVRAMIGDWNERKA